MGKKRPVWICPRSPNRFGSLWSFFGLLIGTVSTWRSRIHLETLRKVNLNRGTIGMRPFLMRFLSRGLRLRRLAVCGAQEGRCTSCLQFPGYDGKKETAFPGMATTHDACGDRPTRIAPSLLGLWSVWSVVLHLQRARLECFNHRRIMVSACRLNSFTVTSQQNYTSMWLFSFCML